MSVTVFFFYIKICLERRRIHCKHAYTEEEKSAYFIVSLPLSQLIILMSKGIGNLRLRPRRKQFCFKMNLQFVLIRCGKKTDTEMTVGKEEFSHFRSQEQEHGTHTEGHVERHHC